MKNGPYELVVAPIDYPGKKYRGRYCYEHHLVWWQHHSAVPGVGDVVHHKDGNKRNNVISNLILMNGLAHLEMHGEEQTSSFVELKCPACDTIFIREKRNSFITKNGRYSVCSRRCMGAMSGVSRKVAKNDKRLTGNVVREFRSTRSEVKKLSR